MSSWRKSRAALVLALLTLFALTNFAKAFDVGYKSLNIEIERKREVSSPVIIEVSSSQHEGEAHKPEWASRWRPQVMCKLIAQLS
jgi:hypothetical protein